MKIQNSVTSREFNQLSSNILLQARQGDVVPITYGRKGDVAAYLIPVSTLMNQDEIEQIREQVGVVKPSVRDIVMSSSVRKDSSDALTQMREEGRY